MDWITIVGIIAASITILSTLYLIIVRVRRFMKAIESRLVVLEDSFKVREELVLCNEIVGLNEENDRMYTLKEGTVVIVYNVVDDIVEFVTSDRLIKSKSNIENFKQE